MQAGKSRFALVAMLLVSGLAGCATPGGKTAATNSAAPARIGSAAWWEENEKLAVFEPGKGYRVPGVEGYFDAMGRPMSGGLEPGVNARSTLVSYDAYDPLDTDKGLLEGLADTSAIKKLKESLGPEKNADTAKKIYQQGEQLFLAKRYDAAAEKFSEAAQRWPDSPLEEKAMFMEAESYFFANRYPKANDGYNALIKKYVNTRFLDRLIKHQFAIARYWEKFHQAEPHWPITPNLFDKTRHLFDTRGHGLKTYENIRLNDPTGPLADDAVMATANSHFLAGRWGDADYYYGQLRKEYPESDYQLQAHLLGLQCKLMRYQGPDYENTPLVEARELVKQLLTQFPEELGDERKRVLEIREQLAASMALRDWTLAQFYEGKSQYGAARYYYTQMIRDYPTTKLAEEARQRMVAIADEPDAPPNYFQWLEDLLPSNKNETIISAQPRKTTTR